METDWIPNYFDISVSRKINGMPLSASGQLRLRASQRVIRKWSHLSKITSIHMYNVLLDHNLISLIDKT